MARNQPGIGRESAAKKTVGFLLLGGMHHILHLVPAAASLSSVIEALVFVMSEEEASACRSLLSKLGKANVQVITLKLPSWLRFVGKLNAKWADLKVPILLSHRKRFRSLSALVVAERTSTLLKRIPGPKPFLIHIPHGAGDRAKGFEPRIKLFDHVIVAGEKDKERMIKEGVVTASTCSVSGYIKAAAVHKISPNLPRLFDNNRDTVIYNPHFDEKLSSWWKYGKDIISYFKDQENFNLIFAPHIRILERLSNEDISFIRSLSGYENILADITSDRLFDMTYTRSADIYVGDVSSQVYEFIYEPRPCVFILPERVDYRQNPDYAHCRFGDVTFTQTDFFHALEISKQKHSAYKDAQQKGAREALGEISTASLDRAAAIIADLVCKSTH